MSGRGALVYRAHLIALVLGLVVGIGCGAAMVSPTPSPTASAALDPCGRVASRGWTTERSYAGGVVPRGDGLQIGVSGRGGADVRVTVRAPDGNELGTSTLREGRVGSTAHYVARYPADFTPVTVAGALGLAIPGTYTVTWEVDGAAVACDRFDVARSGVADARPCAPSGWSAVAPGSTLAVTSGAATMSIGGAQSLLGIVEDPWYAFQPSERQTLALPDGSTVTLYVSVSASPRRVAARFRAGPVPYRFDASGEGVADLVERSREVIVCAQQRLIGAP